MYLLLSLLFNSQIKNNTNVYNLRGVVYFLFPVGLHFVTCLFVFNPIFRKTVMFYLYVYHSPTSNTSTLEVMEFKNSDDYDI